MTEPPALRYGRQWIDDDDVAAVLDVLRGDWLTGGPAVPAFERAVAARGGARHAVAVASGTAALHCAYFAAGLGPGDEIVTTPLTFAATATAAMQLGARVRFADVDPATGNLSAAAAAAALTPAVKAIVPVDYAGHPADYAALRPVADRHGARLIADAAHSFGGAYRGRPVGSLADATAVSFHPVKPITTGEGGAVLTDRGAWSARADQFRNVGVVRDPERLRASGAGWYYEVQSLGLNYRLPDVLCALGSSQLRKLDGFVARRGAIAGRYAEALGDLPALELPVVQDGVAPGWHLFVVRVREAQRRDALFAFLRRQGLGVQVHYHPLHLHPLFADLGHRAGAHPCAEDFAARALSIPLFPKMEDGDADRVIETVMRGAREVL